MITASSASSVLRPALALLTLGVIACSGSSPDPAPLGQEVAVTISPDAATIAPLAQQGFSATVTGTIDQSVTWTVVEGAPGGSVTAEGTYTAPANAGSYHVVATSSADPTKRATATVTVTPSAPPPVAVVISPKTATIAAGGSRTFTCSVSNSSDTACTWSVQEGASGGTVTSAGVYTAPASAGTYHVVAKSRADPSKSDSATVTVTGPSPVVTISITPGSASIDACKTQSFSASVTGTSNTAVTWSVSEGSAGGSVSSAGVYTAPSTGGTYHVVATSQADPTKSRTATVTVTERILSVSVTPTSPTVTAGGTVQFTATVTTTCGAFTQTQALAAGGAVAPN